MVGTKPELGITWTDEAGVARYTDVPAGTYEVFAGYYPTETHNGTGTGKITVGDQAVEVSVELKPGVKIPPLIDVRHFAGEGISSAERPLYLVYVLDDDPIDSLSLVYGNDLTGEEELPTSFIWPIPTPIEAPLSFRGFPLPVGDHEVWFKLADSAGNTDTDTVVVSVRSFSPTMEWPTPFDTLSVVPGSQSSIQVTVSDREDPADSIKARAFLGVNNEAYWTGSPDASGNLLIDSPSEIQGFQPLTVELEDSDGNVTRDSVWIASQLLSIQSTKPRRARIELEWTWTGSENEVGSFEVYQSNRGRGGPYQLIAQLPGTECCYSDTSVRIDHPADGPVPYWYRVSAVLRGGGLLPSQIASAIPGEVVELMGKMAFDVFLQNGYFNPDVFLYPKGSAYSYAITQGGSVNKIHLDSLELTESIPLNGPVAGCLSSEEEKLYVSLANSQEIAVIDLESFTKESSLFLQSLPYEALFVTTGPPNRILGWDMTSESLYLFDTQSGNIIASRQLPVAQGNNGFFDMQSVGKGSDLFVFRDTTITLFSVDEDRFDEVSTVMGTPFPIVISGDEQHLYSHNRRYHIGSNSIESADAGQFSEDHYIVGTNEDGSIAVDEAGRSFDGDTKVRIGKMRAPGAISPIDEELFALRNWSHILLYEWRDLR